MTNLGTIDPTLGERLKFPKARLGILGIAGVSFDDMFDQLAKE